MKKLLLLLFIFCIPFSLAVEINDYNGLDLEVDIYNYLLLQKTSGDYYITEAEILLSWFPRNDFRQSVISLETVPSVVQEDDGLSFVFNRPKEQRLDVQVSSLVSTNSEYLRVSKKVDFPLTSIDSDLAPYLTEGEIIDINEDIRKLANSLSAGKDDLYEVVFAFAEWTQDNIEYNLSTLTSEASQKSSWVLDNGFGVCDELTSLFISLNRAVGIPARFISGIAYTDLTIFF